MSQTLNFFFHSILSLILLLHVSFTDFNLKIKISTHLSCVLILIFKLITFFYYLYMEWCVAPSSDGSSFLGCFGAVHYSLQRCTDWGDQVPARNHLALHPTYWSSICLLFFSTTTKMLSLSLCTDILSTSSCLLL